MATANELFAANGEDYIVIDSDLRTMTFPASVNNIGVENDKDVHKLNFKMPRYYSGYDLSEFIVHINYVNANGDADMYYVLDPTVEENEIIFSWLVGRHACLYRGSVMFIVCLKLADGEGDVAQEFNTTLASLQVLPGLETEPTILETEHDVIEQLLLSINDTNAKIKAVLDTGLTPEQIAEFYNKSKTYDMQITALNTRTTVTNGANYTNLNDLKSTAIYSYDTTSAEVQNAPDTGTYFSGTLYVTYYNANKSSQVYIRPTGDVWVRSWWNGAWRSWTKLANQSDVDTLKSGSNSSYKAALETGSNLNQVTSPGVYMLSGSNSYTNLPDGITYGILEVIKTHIDAGWVLQRLNVGPEMHARFSTNNGASWGGLA